MKLTLDRGLKSYDIEDADGTPLGTIYVNPADLGIAARLDEARKAVQALADGLGDDVDAEKISDVTGRSRSRSTTSLAVTHRLCSSRERRRWHSVMTAHCCWKRCSAPLHLSSRTPWSTP